ncbi:unnamed protein product [Amoebophrya sp. A120]|nr:unnamed protein product [Amoebophrya sp. A120]|eukprot:GSA120T00018040001.1
MTPGMGEKIGSADTAETEKRKQEVEASLTSYASHVQYYLDFCRQLPNSNKKFHTLAALALLKEMIQKAQLVTASVSHHLLEPDRLELCRYVQKMNGDEEWERNVVHLQKLVLESVRTKLDLAAQDAEPSCYPSSNDEEQQFLNYVNSEYQPQQASAGPVLALAPATAPAASTTASPPGAALVGNALTPGGAPLLKPATLPAISLTQQQPVFTAAGAGVAASPPRQQFQQVAPTSSDNFASTVTGSDDGGAGATTNGVAVGAGGARSSSSPGGPENMNNKKAIVPEFISNAANWFFGSKDAPAGVDQAGGGAVDPASMVQFEPVDGSSLTVVPGTKPVPGQLQAPNLFAGLAAQHKEKQNAENAAAAAAAPTLPAVGSSSSTSKVMPLTPPAILGVTPTSLVAVASPGVVAQKLSAAAGAQEDASVPELHKNPSKTRNPEDAREEASGTEPAAATAPRDQMVSATMENPNTTILAEDAQQAGLTAAPGSGAPILPPLDPNTFSFFTKEQEQPPSMEEMMAKVMTTMSQPFEFKARPELNVRPLQPPEAQKIRANAVGLKQESDTIQQKMMETIKRFHSVAGQLPPQKFVSLDAQPLKFLNVDPLHKQGPLTLGKVAANPLAFSSNNLADGGAPPQKTTQLQGGVQRMGTNFSNAAVGGPVNGNIVQVGRGTEVPSWQQLQGAMGQMQHQPHQRGTSNSSSKEGILNQVTRVEPNVEYYSTTHNRWIPAVLLGENSDGTLRLDVKMCAPVERVRLLPNFQPQPENPGAAIHDVVDQVPPTNPVLTQPQLGAGASMAAPPAPDQIISADPYYLPRMAPPSSEQQQQHDAPRRSGVGCGIPDVQALSNLGAGGPGGAAASSSNPGSCLKKVSDPRGLAEAESKAVRFNQKTSVYSAGVRDSCANPPQLGNFANDGGGQGPVLADPEDDREHHLLDTETQQILEMHKLGERYRAFSERVSMSLNNSHVAEEPSSKRGNPTSTSANETSRSVTCPKFMETIDELHGMLVKLLEDPSLADHQEAARISARIEDHKRRVSEFRTSAGAASQHAEQYEDRRVDPQECYEQDHAELAYEEDHVLDAEEAELHDHERRLEEMRQRAVRNNVNGEIMVADDSDFLDPRDAGVLSGGPHETTMSSDALPPHLVAPEHHMLTQDEDDIEQFHDTTGRGYQDVERRGFRSDEQFLSSREEEDVGSYKNKYGNDHSQSVGSRREVEEEPSVGHGLPHNYVPEQHQPTDKSREFYRNGRMYKASYSASGNKSEPEQPNRATWSPPKMSSDFSSRKEKDMTPPLLPLSATKSGNSTRPKRMFSGRVADNAWMRKRQEQED